MGKKPKITEAVEWYSRNRVLYQALAEKVESIVREILDAKEINYHSITSRAKTIDSYRKKTEKYRNPRSEIFDMAGIRVVTYVDSDAKRVHEIIKETFALHPEHSIDKGEELGIDRMGYRSIHCVGTLGRERVKLPENRVFKDIFFEVQIRTILQHAWAEFEHDRNYKFRGVLPKETRRRLSTLAGSLEVIDREFDDIARTIKAYAEDVAKKTELGKLNVPIDSTSLKEYLKKRFEVLVGKGIIPEITNDRSVIREIIDMGINTLQEFDEIIPDDYTETKGAYAPVSEGEAFDSLIIDLLIIHDIDRYFRKAWRNSWMDIDPSDVELYKHFGVDFEKYATKHSINIVKFT